MRKKLSSALLAILFAAHALSAYAAAPVSEKPKVAVGPQKFVVTAYYSPLPGQARYLKGSYEADIRLNGNGTHGASGKPVYAGMLAAPKHYSFGTSIYLDGIGFWTVDDRGGAIVKAGERGHSHDRLDVWMGEGEAGLRRALAWGKRTVEGHVYERESDVPDSTVKLAKLPLAKLEDIVIKPLEERVFLEPVGPNSSSGMIRILSERLVEVGYLKEPSSKYSDAIRNAVVKFQANAGLLKGKSDSNAGYYGPSTRKALKAAYAEKIEEKRLVAAEIEKAEASIASVVTGFGKDVKSLQAAIDSFGTPKPGESGAHVRNLQEALSKLGYFEGKTTGIYGPKTRDAVASFQIERRLVLDRKDPNAGKLGKMTKSALFLSLAEKR